MASSGTEAPQVTARRIGSRGHTGRCSCATRGHRAGEQTLSHLPARRCDEASAGGAWCESER